MLRVTDDILEVRRWAERHGAGPCREERSGRLLLVSASEPCAVAVGWDEWEAAFCASRCVFVYCDTRGRELGHFVGTEEEARRWAEAVLGRREARPSPA